MTSPASVNPWFQKWPQNVQARRDVVSMPPPKPARKMKPLSQFVREGNYPPKFVQIIPFEIGAVPPGQSLSYSIKFDDDFPYRLDSITLEATGPAFPEMFTSILIDLPSGRRLTRNPVDLYAFNGQQGGRAFVPFRHRFNPADLLTITIGNTHPTIAVNVRGFVYGYKLTQDSRL